MPRSAACWATNLYRSAAAAPDSAAPGQDLPAAPGARFREIRTRLNTIPGVVERVQWMGELWRWAWEYSIGQRKLCWLHLLDRDVSATFTLSDDEERRLTATSADPSLLKAARDGQRTGPVRWCALDLHDRRAVAAFASFAEWKASGLGNRPNPGRAPRR